MQNGTKWYQSHVISPVLQKLIFQKQEASIRGGSAPLDTDKRSPNECSHELKAITKRKNLVTNNQNDEITIKNFKLNI